MSVNDRLSDGSTTNSLSYESYKAMPHQLFQGTTWHNRLIPSVHKFAYPYRYWGVNLSALAAGQALPEVALLGEHGLAERERIESEPVEDEIVSTKAKALKSKLLNSGLLNSRLLNNKLTNGLLLFSASHKAVQQFCPSDYLQNPNATKDERAINKSESNSNNHNAVGQQLANKQLLTRLADIFTEQTGSAPSGDMLGLVVCRNAGVYFSPVNFYLGFDKEQTPTHLLAEVSNTPWDKRHYYGFLLDGADSEFCHDKNFHVSPFNPIDQQYCWQVKVEQQDKLLEGCLKIRIAIDISDVRGEVLKTGIKMTGIPMTAQAVRQSLKQNSLMNITSLTRIYWHAFKLYALKKVPYISYDEKLAESKQHKSN